ncbi:MAG: autotransporter assembly complex protein TamA, partial [Steroidobacteraceae bacterium]
VLNSFGYYEGAVTITIDGLGLDSPQLADALTALPKGQEARVKITPTLGPLFRVGRIEIQGSLPPDLALAVGLPGALLSLKAGAPAIASDVLEAGTSLQTRLQDDGYAFATVSKPVAYEKPEQRVLDLTYRVTTGPRVKIGEIRIEGLKHVHEALVRRRLLIRTGEPYDAATVEKARQDLLTLGVFASVTARLGKTADRAGRVPITFLVKEAKRFTFGVSAAYSSDLGGSGGINWSDDDVFGGAQQLSIAANVINLGGTASTGLGYEATIGYTLPDFHRRDQTLHFTLEGIRQILQAYAENGQLGGVILSRKLSSVWSATAGVTYEHELIGQPGATCTQAQQIDVGGITVCPYSEINDYNLVLLPITALYDSTNLSSPLVDPTHGFRISLNFAPTLSYGTAGKMFFVSQVSAATYLDMHKLFPGDPAGRTVLATKVMAGLIQGTIWNNVPPDQRFYAGGSG